MSSGRVRGPDYANQERPDTMIGRMEKINAELGGELNMEIAKVVLAAVIDVSQAFALNPKLSEQQLHNMLAERNLNNKEYMQQVLDHLMGRDGGTSDFSIGQKRPAGSDGQPVRKKQKIYFE